MLFCGIRLHMLKPLYFECAVHTPSYFHVAAAHCPIQRERHLGKQQRCCCQQLRGSGKVQRHCCWQLLWFRNRAKTLLPADVVQEKCKDTAADSLWVSGNFLRHCCLQVIMVMDSQLLRGMKYITILGVWCAAVDQNSFMFVGVMLRIGTGRMFVVICVGRWYWEIACDNMY